MRRWIVLSLSLVVVAIVSSVLTLAQAPQGEPRVVPGTYPVISGNDLGFRVEGMNRSGEPTGTFVVRVKGEWVPVGYSAKIQPVR